MSLTEEESNFLRFYFLNLKIASKAVRVYFDSIYPPAVLAKELKNNETHLKKLPFITSPQRKMIYPGSVNIVQSEQFDITLMICLLRNMNPCHVGPAPATGWDNLPQQADTCCSADLARIKWYRNYVSHHEKGELVGTDLSQYWADLEQAILRLGGQMMHTKAKAAQHVVLDTSLTDMLLELRNNEKSQQEQTKKINNLQSDIQILRTNKEELEKKAQRLNVCHQEVATETQKLTNTISDYKGTIDAFSKDIETCKKQIKKNTEMINELEDQSVTKQNKIADLITIIDNLEIKYKQHDKMLKEQKEHLTKHDGQIKTCVKSIADMKQKLRDTDDTSVKGKRKRMEDDTEALIEADFKEGTFVNTKAVTDGLLLLKQNGVLLITGHAGTGKSRIGRHVLHMFCTDDTSYTCIKLNTLEEWKDMVNGKKHVAVFIDDIFGETNSIYNREKDNRILDKVHSYVCKGNIKVIITIRDTVKRHCQEVFDSHRLFQSNFIDLSSDKYVLSWEEKKHMLINYMKTVRKSGYTDNKGFLNNNEDTILGENEVREITNENPVKGFPLVVYQFVHNDKYFHLGSNFFDRPTEAMLEEMNAIRRKGGDDIKFMIQYAVMVYTAINENCINLEDKSCVTEVLEIIDAIYGKKMKLKKCQISDEVKELKGSYLVNVPNQKSYRLHHPTLQESVIISFAQIEEENINKIIPLISWSFFLKIVKSESYNEKEGEIVLRIPNNSYKLLAGRLVDMLITEFWIYKFHSGRWGSMKYLNKDQFVCDLITTEIFQREYGPLLTDILDILEKNDIADKHMENMIRSDDIYKWKSFFHLESKCVLLANLLVEVAKTKSLNKMYTFILTTLHQMIQTTNNYFTIEYMKGALTKSIYNICTTKSVHSFKVTLDIIEKNTIPIIIDQGIAITDLRNTSSLEYMDNDSATACIFIIMCIFNAYTAYNVPLLKYLLLKYNQTPFDLNLFLKMIYGDTSLERKICSISHLPLQWMIKRFADQELNDTDFILETACRNQMFETVDYLAPRCKTFDAISCFKIFLNVSRCNDEFQNEHYLCSRNKVMFNFLFSKIDSASKELIPIVFSILKSSCVPDYMFDAFLPVCIDNAKILTLACNNGHLYVIDQIIENSHFQFPLQSALFSAFTCMITQSHKTEKRLKMIEYIGRKFGFEQFDIKAACQQACDSKDSSLVKWFVQNIDITMLDVYPIINLACGYRFADTEFLECIMNKINDLYGRKFESKQCNAEHFTILFEIIRTLWNNTKDKHKLQINEIVNKAYELECFELLMWIHENCKPYISIEGQKLFMFACGAGRIDIANWVLQNFEKRLLNIEEGHTFMIACNALSGPAYGPFYGKPVVTSVLELFQIKPLDLKSGLLRIMINHSEFRYHSDFEIEELLVCILGKYGHRLSIEYMEEILMKSLELNFLSLVELFVENSIFCSFGKQFFLDLACDNAMIETVKMLRKYFPSLNINQAMIHACTGGSLYQRDDCLHLLWEERDNVSLDVCKIVSVVCMSNVRDSVMTWILLNMPHDQIPMHKILYSCCMFRKLFHIKYIYYKIFERQCYIDRALFVEILKNEAKSSEFGRDYTSFIFVEDFVYTKLHVQDKVLILSSILKKLIDIQKFYLILYFLKKGYYMNIDMNYLMNVACRHGAVGLVQWILANIERKDVNIKSAFIEACKCTDTEKQLKCVSLLWHYIQDISMFEIDTVLTFIEEAPKHMADKNLKLQKWIKYIRNINRKAINSCKSDTVISLKEHIDPQLFVDTLLYMLFGLYHLLLLLSMLEEEVLRL